MSQQTNPADAGGAGAAMAPGIALSAAQTFGNFMSQSNTNKAQEMLSLEQMNWQKMMSDTAHLREVQDLKNAGLNPILSAGGSGASTPSGAMANLTAPQINMPDIFTYGLSMRQMQQRDRELDMQQKKVDNDILESGGRQKLNYLNFQLGKKGLPMSIVGEKGAGLLNMFLDKAAEALKVQPPKYPSEQQFKQFQKFNKQYQNFEQRPLEFNRD